MLEGRNVKLGFLCNIELGKTPARKSPQFWDAHKKTNNVWLSIADMPDQLHAHVTDSKEYLSDSGYSLCKVVPKGTLLVSFKLTLGKLVFAGCNLVTNEAIAALYILDEEVISKEYLYWFLTFFDWDKAAEGDIKIKGKTLNKAKLKNIDIFVPTMEQQKRIVAILDEAFAGIDKAIENTEKNLANAKELFDSYLNNIFTQKGDGWESRLLGDVFEITSSKRIMEKEWTSSGVPFYGGKEIVMLAKTGVAISNAYISEEKYRDYASKYDMPRQGDILVTARGTIGVGYVVQKDDKFYYKDGNIISMRGRISTNPYFLLFAFRSNIMASQLGNLTGTTVKHLPIQKTKELLLGMPDVDVQNTVVENIQKVEDETKCLEQHYQQKLNTLKELKQSLLQKAFSGELTSEMRDVA